MLDINFIRKNTNKVKKAAKDKGYDVDIEKLIKVDDKRRELIEKIEKLKQEKNKLSAKASDFVNSKKSKKHPFANDLGLIKKSKAIKKKLDDLEPKLRKVEKEFDGLMLQVPNIPSKDSPIGKDESHNKVIKKWGKIPKFKFGVKDHVELGNQNNLLDIERGVKIGGTRSYILKNELVLLEQAVLKYAIDKIRKEGFEVMNVPVMVREEALVRSGFFPHGKDDVYHIDEDKYLVGTSEASLVSYYAGETLQGAELPKLLGALTTCFRREVGTYGKDTKGVFRVHQFNKVEQVVICRPEEGEKMFNFILNIAESFVRDFGLPYRLVEIATGDMGPKNYRQIDIEVWFPGQDKYRETHSCSWLTDYQARRANIKYRDDNGKKYIAHTLNCTVVPTPRFLIALLENNQQKDGSIKIPKVLQSYMGMNKISNN